MSCYITRTSSFLPGPAIANNEIEQHLGTLPDEAETKATVLAMNGIQTRHYAQDENQQPTHDVYELAYQAIVNCLGAEQLSSPISMLATGTTYSPLFAPGAASILHSRLRDRTETNHPMEISSHGGICSSAAAALVNAIRAVSAGEHQTALCVGADHPSQILKASEIRPIDDRREHSQLRNSQWFMSVFLRFMLSDGAGAMVLQDSPDSNQLSLKVNWTHSLSFAHATELCMKLDSKTALLSQNLMVLSRFLFPCGERFLRHALDRHDDSLDNYRVILPHLSSFFFRKKFERAIKNSSADADHPTPYWTNLATAGNTGAASIYIMLDEFLRLNSLQHGERVLLFVPESGQFNYVLISLTAVAP